MGWSSPFRHRHRWTPVGTATTPVLFTGEHLTRLLRRCRCGEFDSLHLAGKWPAEWFQPPPVRTSWGDWLLLVLPAAFAVDNAARGLVLATVVWSLVGLYGAYLVARTFWRQRNAKATPVEEPSEGEA